MVWLWGGGGGGGGGGRTAFEYLKQTYTAGVKGYLGKVFGNDGFLEIVWVHGFGDFCGFILETGGWYLFTRNTHLLC